LNTSTLEHQHRHSFLTCYGRLDMFDMVNTEGSFGGFGEGVGKVDQFKQLVAPSTNMVLI